MEIYQLKALSLIGENGEVGRLITEMRYFWTPRVGFDVLRGARF